MLTQPTSPGLGNCYTDFFRSEHCPSCKTLAKIQVTGRLTLDPQISVNSGSQVKWTLGHVRMVKTNKKNTNYNHNPTKKKKKATIINNNNKNNKNSKNSNLNRNKNTPQKGFHFSPLRAEDLLWHPTERRGESQRT